MNIASRETLPQFKPIAYTQGRPATLPVIAPCRQSLAGGETRIMLIPQRIVWWSMHQHGGTT